MFPIKRNFFEKLWKAFLEELQPAYNYAYRVEEGFAYLESHFGRDSDWLSKLKHVDVNDISFGSEHLDSRPYVLIYNAVMGTTLGHEDVAQALKFKPCEQGLAEMCGCGFAAYHGKSGNRHHLHAASLAEEWRNWIRRYAR